MALYGWVDDEVFTQSSLVAADMLSELRRELRLTADRVAEGDYVLEAAGPSERLPFRASEDRTHFLWVYTEMFTRLGVRLHFNDFQKEVMTRCQGPKLFDAFDESIQEFKWNYFNVLPFPSRRPFWLDDEGAPFPWVYWNSEVEDYRITTLDPLETLVYEFLHSLPGGLGKKSNFKCRWILDHGDVEVGMFLDSLLEDMDKQFHFDRLWTKMAEVEGACSRSILPTPTFPAASARASVSVSAATVPQGSSLGPVKTKKKTLVTSSVKPISVEKEEGEKEDPSVNLKQKRRMRKVQESFPEEAALGADSAWEHKVNPIDRAFPAGFNFRGALDSGLTQDPIREILGFMLPEQRFGTTQHLSLLAFRCTFSCLLLPPLD
ncbi:hypothetical protein PIB30_022806 [Stylosanthes scabra]|uniref:Uncharacterized protein n=1 Tax=Stylosanthes scabra TaxID=79078 RepID=A0ABU6U892_9FABA|nr:hypothetical protein [Stylosanthes scabra]